jgi:hypothetical protein
MVSEVQTMQHLCLISQLPQLPIITSNVAAGLHHTQGTYTSPSATHTEQHQLPRFLPRTILPIVSNLSLSSIDIDLAQQMHPNQGKFASPSAAHTDQHQLLSFLARRPWPMVSIPYPLAIDTDLAQHLLRTQTR